MSMDALQLLKEAAEGYFSEETKYESFLATLR
jgi:hypothetical protein